jgi:hypothetical protein
MMHGGRNLGAQTKLNIPLGSMERAPKSTTPFVHEPQSALAPKNGDRPTEAVQPETKDAPTTAPQDAQLHPTDPDKTWSPPPEPNGALCGLIFQDRRDGLSALFSAIPRRALGLISIILVEAAH